MIDLQRLIACGVSPSIARVIWADLAFACNQFEINSVTQQAAFIAQAMHESRGFSHLEESLWYTTPQRITQAFARLRASDHNVLLALCRNPKGLARAAYSRINGNGGLETEDGWTYRGGGPFQLTGRGNYKACGQALDRPFETQPELIRRTGQDAALSAAWFWHSRGCNTIMATDSFDSVTKMINGGMSGAAERRNLYIACTAAFRHTEDDRRAA